MWGDAHAPGASSKRYLRYPRKVVVCAGWFTCSAIRKRTPWPSIPLSRGPGLGCSLQVIQDVLEELSQNGGGRPVTMFYDYLGSYYVISGRRAAFCKIPSRTSWEACRFAPLSVTSTLCCVSRPPSMGSSAWDPPAKRQTTPSRSTHATPRAITARIQPPTRGRPSAPTAARRPRTLESLRPHPPLKGPMPPGRAVPGNKVQSRGYRVEEQTCRPSRTSRREFCKTPYNVPK